jgi:hypothetical protein
MHVDRTRFLMLTAAMAASCAAQQKQAPEPIVARPDDYDTTSGSAPQPVPVDQSVIAQEELVQPPPEPPPPAAEDPGPAWAQPRPGLPARDPVLSQRCAAIKRPGPVCESFADTIDSCSLYSTVMVPKAASAAVKCLTQRSGTKRICQFGVDATCALQGTKAAPRNPSAKSICASILSSCAGSGYRGKDLTRANCEAALSGYDSSVRSQLVSCATEFCELGPCFYSLAR